MSKLNIMQILKTLKIKNGEGFDRIPLKIFNEGAEILNKPLSPLFNYSYNKDNNLPQNYKHNYWVPNKPPTITAKLFPIYHDFIW